MKNAFTFYFCICSVLASAQINEQDGIDKTMQRFLRYLSFADSASLKIDSLTAIFVPGSKLTANFGNRPMSYTVPEYITLIQNGVRSGQTISSRETEMARKVDIFGKIAHVLSTYELTITSREGTVVRRGINSIQLIKQDGVWFIQSLIWDRESDSLKLPAKYLSN